MSTVTAPPMEPKPEIREQQPTALISRGVRARPLFDPEIMRRAIQESFIKLNPVLVAKNPVMFVVEVGAALTTLFVVKDAFTGAGGALFGIQIALWLWFTVVFANFAEAMAEARGKAQADALRKTKTDTMARKLLPNDKFEMVPASKLRAGDVV
jgi:K+-transporting ATPase ATPase B chain